MKNKMTDIDNLIKQTLSEEEAEFYNELDEQNALEMLGGVFRGKNRWIMILLNIVMVVVFAIFIYCLINFLKTDNTNELIRWGGGGFICLTSILMVKLFVWMQMDKNAILREMKRLELQMSSLAAKQS